MASELGITTLLLGMGGSAYLWINRVRIREVAHCRWLFAGYMLMLLGALGATLDPGAGLLQVVGFTGSTLALGYWCRLVAPALSEEQS